MGWGGGGGHGPPFPPPMAISGGKFAATCCDSCANFNLTRLPAVLVLSPVVTIIYKQVSLAVNLFSCVCLGQCY